MKSTLIATVEKLAEELDAERTRIDRQLQACHQFLATMNGHDGQFITKEQRGVVTRPARRGMSAQARKAVSERMKVYWAKRRKAMAKNRAVKTKR